MSTQEYAQFAVIRYSHQSWPLILKQIGSVITLFLQGFTFNSLDALILCILLKKKKKEQNTETPKLIFPLKLSRNY